MRTQIYLTIVLAMTLPACSLIKLETRYTDETAPALQTVFRAGIASDKPGVMLSPFWPHKMIDVAGIPSGSIVQDPWSRKLVRVP